MTRRLALQAIAVHLALVACHSGQAEESRRVEDAIARGVAWLTSQQAKDGGWHSETYGAYRSGVGTTALAVLALSKEQAGRPSQSFQQGLAFLTARRDERGFVVAPDGGSDNALYATAITLRVLTHVQRDSELRTKLQQSLAAARHDDSDNPDSPDAGGWASLITGKDEVSSEAPCNLSATTAVLVARPDLRDLKPTSEYVSRCQNFGDRTPDDGGFFFTPHRDHPLNKISTTLTASGKPRPVSYFSATCDGIICENIFQLDGFSTAAARRTRAVERLAKLPRPSLLAAAPLADDPRPSPIDGLYFYSAAAFADVWQLNPLDRPQLKPIRDEFIQTILQRQRDHGDWMNPVNTMREDDPLIATALAITALRRLSDSPH